MFFRVLGAWGWGVRDRLKGGVLGSICFLGGHLSQPHPGDDVTTPPAVSQPLKMVPWIVTATRAPPPQCRRRKVRAKIQSRRRRNHRYRSRPRMLMLIQSSARARELASSARARELAELGPSAPWPLSGSHPSAGEPAELGPSAPWPLSAPCRRACRARPSAFFSNPAPGRTSQSSQSSQNSASQSSQSSARAPWPPKACGGAGALGVGGDSPKWAPP